MKQFLRRSLYAGGVLLLMVSLWFTNTLSAQPAKTWYDASIDGNAQLDAAISKVKGSKKYILVQVGGDWCRWCIKLNQTIEGDAELSKLMNEKYEWVHLHYDKKNNRNEKAMERLKNPTSHGFPVFVLLDSHGHYLKTFPTSELEEGNGYSHAKLVTFLQSAPQHSSNAMSPVPPKEN